MLIVALVMAVIGLAALVTAVVTSNAVIAWVCIGASIIGVLILIVDALRDRAPDRADETDENEEPVETGEPVETVEAEDAPSQSDEPADESDNHSRQSGG